MSDPIIVKKYGGKAIVYKNVFNSKESAKYFNLLHKTLPWHIKKIHGNVDRPIFDYATSYQSKKTKTLLLKLKNEMEKRLEIEMGSDSFANHYRDKKDRTFWHLDHDINPDENIYVVSFGGDRVLTFIDLRTNESHDFLLQDGDVVSFDYEWNIHMVHAVEKSKIHTEPRISLQYFNRKYPERWNERENTRWKKALELRKKVVSKRRTLVNKGKSVYKPITKSINFSKMPQKRKRN